MINIGVPLIGEVTWVKSEDGMKFLMEKYPDGKAHFENFYHLVLFSGGGVHGDTSTIEEEEMRTEDLEYPPCVTFVSINVTMCNIWAGECNPRTHEDFQFLKQLRQSSWEVAAMIGTN
jgi:hypothetical protein